MGHRYIALFYPNSLCETGDRPRRDLVLPLKRWEKHNMTRYWGTEGLYEGLMGRSTSRWSRIGAYFDTHSWVDLDMCSQTRYHFLPHPSKTAMCSSSLGAETGPIAILDSRCGPDPFTTAKPCQRGLNTSPAGVSGGVGKTETLVTCAPGGQIQVKIAAR